MRLCNGRYEEIKGEVIELFFRCDVRCIPISGFEIAIKLGITLVPYSSLSHKKLITANRVSPDGFYLEPGDGKEYIYYHDRMGYKRANMTILHEIGHCVLGHHDGMDQDEAETEAKFFAKYAAAPPPLVHRIKPDVPEQIEETFLISYEASVYALAYYRKWLRRHCKAGLYFDYERHLLRLFKEPA